MFVRGDCRLRPVERDDLPALVEWIGDEDVRENLMMRLPMSMTQEQSWYDGLQKASHRAVFSIDIDDGNGFRHVGICGLEEINRTNGWSTMGIFIGDKTLWGKGYGTKAMAIAMEIGFCELRLHRLALEVFTDNARGIKSYEKLGFVHEGTLRQKVFRHGKYIDAHIMSVLAPEYFAANPNRRR